MVDKNDSNDEYQFADLDVIESDSLHENDAAATMANERAVANRSVVRRNALIVIVIIILAMLFYKFMGPMFSSKTPSVEPAIPPVTPINQVTQPPVDTQPITPVQPVQPVDQGSNSEISQKLSALELSQQSARSEISAVGTQLGSVNNNINELSTQVATLTQMVNSLSAKLDEQARDINNLIARATPRPAPRIVRKTVRRAVYYIQAVIPGRAWLIASNGSTLTVREGSNIPGYGIVKLIDPNQGRVVTSSGQIIRFSQQDS